MIQDNSAKWKLKKLTGFGVSLSNNPLPLGHIYQSLTPNVPVGSIPLFGGLYDRNLYQDLWTWAQEMGMVVSENEWQALASANDGNVPKFSDGDGSTTFRVPSLKCWVKGANGVEEVGSYLEAGLPNITGDFGVRKTSNNGAILRSPKGAFSVISNGSDEGKVETVSNSSTTQTPDIIEFNASDSNLIYGNSDTVQPPSIVGMWCIVAYGSVSNIGNADVANVMQAVEQVQTQISHVDSKIKPFLPDYSACVTIPSFPYTAPTDGFVFIALEVPKGKPAFLKADNQFLDAVYNASTTVACVYYTQGFVKKGTVITAHENSGFGAEKYFYPLKASV